ncbi:MAG: rhodanese-related sulfurtransferase [Hyphomicrobiaceae bacterium]
MNQDAIVVVALYKFVPLHDIDVLRADLFAACSAAGVVGTLLLAPEGINGTIAGSRNGIDTALDAIRAIPGCADITHKESSAVILPFQKLKVRLKTEIVKLGLPEINPNNVVGTYVEPEDWNALIADPDVVLIDTRNAYEIAIGTFDGAIDPQTEAFREFPAWADNNLDPKSHKRIAMFCTGGIRCEKATSLLKERGFDQVYHLKGGILKYLERIPEDESIWRGDCFVFDDRVSLRHGLQLGDYEFCPVCDLPVKIGSVCCEPARAACRNA